MAGRLRTLSFAFLAGGLAVCLACSPAYAQSSLADPTRPPSGAPGFVNSDEAAGGRVLQSVLIPRHGKPLAVIDGHTVRLGQRYGEARLVRVSERDVVLDGPDGIEHLQLTPGIEKTNIRPVHVKNGATRAPARLPARNEG